MSTYKYRVICKYCGKECAPSLRGFPGDGTVYFPRRHKHNGQPCPGNIPDVDVSEPEFLAIKLSE